MLPDGNSGDPVMEKFETLVTLSHGMFQRKPMSNLTLWVYQILRDFGVQTTEQFVGQFVTMVGLEEAA